ncbi:hypothetical protein ZIOFF_044458 [Zingiber officinale]|uniref:Rhodanese domain-containing protein n=1 Tax=Zingiber officinale TaxID=94328 RepID=A0A8J5FX80_ZINOF|nr:hypothetical protein ZIOFF_044458 [Zingiber officinale]
MIASAAVNPRLSFYRPRLPSGLSCTPSSYPAAASSRSASRRVCVRSAAATKPAKSPAEEDWKIKRELLLQKRVRSVDVKEALRLQKENNFVILDVRPEAEFKELNTNHYQHISARAVAARGCLEEVQKAGLTQSHKAVTRRYNNLQPA